MDIAAVYTRSEDELQAHPVHKGWLDELSAEPVYFEKASLPGSLSDSVVGDFLSAKRTKFSSTNYDVFVFESPSSLHLLPHIKSRNPDSVTIFLHTTWRFLGRHAHNWDDWTFPLNFAGQFDRSIDELLLRHRCRKYLDGIITVSELAKNIATHPSEEGLSSFYHPPIEVPVEIIHPHIPEDHAESLKHITPSVGEKQFVTIAHDRGHKGVDRLVRAWPRVRESHPEAELTLVGPGQERWKDTAQGVNAPGFVDDLDEVLSESSAYIHPARFDAFPISTLEAMLSGLPTLVSTTTGTRSVVREVDSELCFTLDSLEENVVDFLDMDLEDKERLSRDFKQKGSEFAIKNEHKFEEKFYRLVNEIYS